MTSPSPTTDKPTPDLPPGESFVLTLPDDPASGKDWYLWAGVLALLVFVAFFPAATGSLVWDDDHHAGLIANYSTPAGLAELWIPGKATPQYYPLTFTSFWIDYQIFKDNTLGNHLGNLLLHAGSAILVWQLLKRLAVPGAWVAAAIWAVHPLQTESVCWISERKNVLSGLLFFASIWFYLDYAGIIGNIAPGASAKQSAKLTNPNYKWLAYGSSLLLLALGLLAKTVVCAMPAVMLIILWWKSGRQGLGERKITDKKTWLPLIPFFALGLAMSALTVYLETAPGGNVEAVGADWMISPLQRLLIASRGVWFYIAKLAWPMNLTFSYPRIFPSADAIGSAAYAMQWVYLLAAIAVVAVLWRYSRKTSGGFASDHRGPLAAILFYGVTLFPALGFINIFPMRYSFVADHFQYLSGLGLIVLAVAAVTRLLKKFTIPPAALAGVAAVLLAALSTQSWLQAHIYESPETLYRDTLAKNPDSWMASDNLGIELIKLGETSQRAAADDSSQGLTDAAAEDTKEASDHFAEAESWFHHALALRPANYATHNALGLLYRTTGRWPEAETELKTAVEMDEKDDIFHQLTAPYVNYATVLAHNHPGMDVRPWLDKTLALEKQPRVKATDLAVANNAYGQYWMSRASADSRASNTEAESADLQEAITHYEAGLQKLTSDTNSQYALATAYQRMGDIDQDKANRALASGQMGLANEYDYKSHEIDDARAMTNYLAVVQRIPRFAPALLGIGTLYARSEADNESDALKELLLSMQFFKDALSIDPSIPSAADNLISLSKQFLADGAKAAAHEAVWAKLHDLLKPLTTATTVTPAAATAADQPAYDALWPLSSDHPLRDPLFAFRGALHAYLSLNTAPDAAKNVADTAAAVLKVWDQRSPQRDAVSDAMNATLCYQGAVTADERAGAAWYNLQSSINVLAAAMKVQTDVPGAADALKQAQFVLDQHRATTQPVPATQPIPTTPQTSSMVSPAATQPNR